MKTMFFLSDIDVSTAKTLVFFLTEVDSPVKIASSMLRSTDSNSRPSALTRSPASRIRISPGTTSLVGITVPLPSLNTFALGAVSFSIASIAFSDRYS